MARWGKAGERLNPDGTRDEHRLRALRARVGPGRAVRAAHELAAYKLWRAGLVIPNRITTALDLRSLYGPEVDEACCAHEPEVAQWEAGERYPTWEQLLALSALTGFPVSYFTLPGLAGPIPVWETSLWHTMSEPDREVAVREWNPVLGYPRGVLDARADSPPDIPPVQRRDPLG